MSNGVNRVTLLGNLCTAVDLRATSGGQAVANLRVATNESYLDKNRERKERVEYHSVVIWGRRAEALAKILDKGSRVFVEGSLRTTSYEDKQGQKRYKTEVNAVNIILCGGSRGERGDSSGGGESDGFDESSLGEDDEKFPF